MKVALIIGGTGMLAGLSRKLTERFDVVGVVGRTAANLQNLQSFSPKIIGMRVDYSDSADLAKILDRFIKTHGRPQLVVSWIHSTSPGAALLVSRYCSGDFYDLTGHDGIRPDHPSRHREKDITARGITYHRIILGRKGNRWLTHDEISSGVYKAVQADQSEFVAGELHD